MKRDVFIEQLRYNRRSLGFSLCLFSILFWLFPLSFVFTYQVARARRRRFSRAIVLATRFSSAAMHPALALALFSCLLVRSAAAVNLQTPSKCSGDDGVMQSKTLTPTVAATDSSGNHHPTPAPKRVKRRGKCTKRDVFASLDRDRLASACSSIGVTPVTITETASARPHTWSIDAHCPVTVTETLTETDTRLSSHYITDAATAIVTVTAIETVTSTQLETETQPWTYTEVHTELHTEVYTVESVTSIQWTNIDTTTATATMTETAILTETATLTVTTTAAPAPICKNGNFESGNTDGWTVYSRTGTGDAQVVESFGYGSSHSLKMSTSGASGEDNKVVYGQEINWYVLLRPPTLLTLTMSFSFQRLGRSLQVQLRRQGYYVVQRRELVDRLLGWRQSRERKRG